MAAARLHGLDQPCDLVRHDFRRLHGHQPGDGEFDQSEFLPAGDDHDAAADVFEPVRRQRHVALVRADHDHVVAVVRHGRRHRAVDRIAEPRHEPVRDRPRRPMPLDDGDLAHVGRPVHRDQSAGDGQFVLQRACWRLVLDHADHPRFHPLRARWRGNVEVRGGQRARHAHGILGTRGIGGRWKRRNEPATFGEHVAARDHSLNRQRRKIRGQNDIRPAARRDGPDFPFEPEVLRRVERRHLDRRHGLQPFGDGVPHHPGLLYTSRCV